MAKKNHAPFTITLSPKDGNLRIDHPLISQVFVVRDANLAVNIQKWVEVVWAAAYSEGKRDTKKARKSQ